VTQPTLLERAKQGDAGAIATLLNRSFRMQGVVVSASIQGEWLSLMLEAAQVPDQATTVRFIRRSLAQFAPTSIAAVRVFGREHGAQSPTWREEFSLEEIAECDRASNSSPGNDPQAATPPNSLVPKSDPLPVSPRPNYLADEPLFTVLRGLPVQHFDNKALEAAIAGIFLAFLLLLSKQVTFICSYFIILIHELGHAFTAWSFGYPAIPAFDFLYGGGVTMHLNRVPVFAIAIYAAIGYLFYRYRKNQFTLGVLFGFSSLYTLFAITPLHEILQIGMGHGFELIFAIIFLYRGLSGYACRYSIERPLYAMLAFFTVFRGCNFSWRLIFDLDYRSLYEYGKGGLLDNDFVRLARDYFGTNLSSVAVCFLCFCILTPVFTVLLYRYRHRWTYLVLKLLQKEAILS